MVWNTLALLLRQKLTKILKNTCKKSYVTQFLHKNLLFKLLRSTKTFPLFMPLAIFYRIFSCTNKILFKNIHFSSLHKDFSLASSSIHASTAPRPPRLNVNINQLNSTPFSSFLFTYLGTLLVGSRRWDLYHFEILYEVEGSFPKLTVNKVGKSRSQKPLYYFYVPCICSTAAQQVSSTPEIVTFVLIFCINIIWFLTVHVLFLLSQSSSIPIQELIQTASNINCSHKRE